jgi:tight adherence protein C
MLDLIYDKVSDPQLVVSFLVAIAAAATVLTVAMPLLDSDSLSRRMKAVSTERERLRQRERERLAKQATKVSLRQEPKAILAAIVRQLHLTSWLGTEEAAGQLAMAGFRGRNAETVFLVARLFTPIALFLVACLYLFVITDLPYATIWKVLATLVVAYAGIKAPEIFLRNTITKRQLSIKRAFPDTLDLMLICVESGMSIEHAFRKVGTEIGGQSVPMAEELALTTAELSYLPDRRVAYENFGKRTGLEQVRSIALALTQAEKYGTPLGAALRVLSLESRDTRMMEAEKKAAALPPKLTVPMILFFLPVLFFIIGTPAGIQVMRTQGL